MLGSPGMTREALKAAVQPHLQQDFDPLYDAFVAEHGAEDPVAFIAHLASFQLIPSKVARDLTRPKTSPGVPPPQAGHPTPAPPPPPAWTGTGKTSVPKMPVPSKVVEAETELPPIRRDFGADAFDDESRTVVGDDPAARKEPRPSAGTAAAEPSPPSDNRAPATAPRPLGGGLAAGLGGPTPPLPDDEPADEDEDPNKGKRTMFRRQSDGNLRLQTDVVEVEKQESRRKRRRKEEAPPGDPPVGEPGRYTFIKIVGEGAMGKVHVALDGKLQRKVAFKAMSAEIAEHEELALKFAAEARITAQLDHPNIVPVYNLETPSTYTMKLIKGITVEDIIQETLKRLVNHEPLQEVHTLHGRLELFLRACDALYYAHSRGVVHRDLKPENIMVGEFNELYIMDWGIARLMHGEFEDKVVSGIADEEGDYVIGTPGYMSPEQAEGLNSQLDGRSDQYSLGLILFELVSLTPAVTGKAPLKIVMRHQDGEKDPLVHAAGHRIDRELRAIIHKATAKDPKRRYETVHDLADDIKAYLRGDPTEAAPDNVFQAFARWMGRHRQATAFVAFAAVSMFAFVAVAAIAYSQVALARAEAAEQLRTNLLADAAAQSSIIDGQFLKYEGLLSLIATHAEDSMGRPVIGNATVYTSKDFDADKGPPDLIQSSRYDRPVSLSRSAFVLPPDTNLASVQGTMGQLQSLDRHFYRVMLRSHSEAAGTYTPKRAERALVDVGVPIARAYVGLENGLHASYPGHGKWPDNYDPRTNAWYKLAKSRRGPIWGAPAVDLHGLGLILTCAQAMYDGNDNLLGVAGIDVTFDYIIEELLELPGFEGAPGSEAFLLDPEGHVMVRSSRKGAAFDGNADGRTLTLRDFNEPEVVQAVKEKRSGYVQTRGDSGPEIVVYNRMNSIGWYYVVAGPEDELLTVAAQ